MMMEMEAAALAADARLERMDRVAVLYAEMMVGRVFFSPLGKTLAGTAPMPLTDVDALLRRNRERGVEPDWRTGLPPADAT